MYMTSLGSEVVGAERQAHDTAGWWVALVTGLLTIAFGIVVLRVNWTVSGLAVFLGVVFIARGLADALAPSVDGGPHGPRVFTGMLQAGVGAALIVWPGPGLAVVATFFGCWLVVGGMLEIVGSLLSREQSGWWLVLLLGILMLILGVWALDRPAATLQLLIALAGIWGVALGTLEVVFALELRKAHSAAVTKERTIERGGMTPHAVH
jgi:uncharacterized membrane protein HdeD (DUF308 family)